MTVHEGFAVFNITRDPFELENIAHRNLTKYFEKVLTRQKRKGLKLPLTGSNFKFWKIFRDRFLTDEEWEEYEMKSGRIEPNSFAGHNFCPSKTDLNLFRTVGAGLFDNEKKKALFDRTLKLYNQDLLTL